ncbi:MAG: hypothetical protein HY849_10480 [Nitrosomonadales bacterium]|nr:hypothetical protein [Nitrosomonadales bacterium]
MKIRMLLGGAMLSMLTLNAWAANESTAAGQAAASALGSGEVSFKNDVQPILHDYCLSCHSPGGKGFLKSGLDMTSYEGLMKGTQFGPVVLPGNSEESTFTKLLTGTNKGLKMPFGLNAAGTLDRQYILTLRRWVKQGAKNN